MKTLLKNICVSFVRFDFWLKSVAEFSNLWSNLKPQLKAFDDSSSRHLAFFSHPLIRQQKSSPEVQHNKPQCQQLKIKAAKNNSSFVVH